MPARGEGPAMKFKFPTAFTLLFGLIVVVAALTWIIPAGQYQRAMNETLGKEAPVRGTYAQVEANQQGLLAPLADFAGVARSLVVTAYQSANGWVNLFNPTFAVVMGG